MTNTSRNEDDSMRVKEAQSQDISIIPEEDESSPESGPVLAGETEDSMQVQREETMTQPETDSMGVLANQEDNPDLEEETAID